MYYVKNHHHPALNDDCTLDNVPSAPSYVLADDTFMSGWGLCDGEDGRPSVNTVVLPCVNSDEAIKVAARIRKWQTDCENVRVVNGHGKVGNHKGVLLTVLTRKDAAKWYDVNSNVW